MNNCFILLAAGKGKRFNSKEKKQFFKYKNKPLFMHSIDKAKKSKLFKKIVLVTNKQIKISNVDVIKGGKVRSDSSFKGLKYLLNKKIKNVFIHDAARPNFSINLLKKLKKNLNNNKAVVPYINTNNSTKYAYKNKVVNLKRERVYLTQTPQCFDFKTLYNLSKNNKNSVTDESALFLNNNKKIKFIKGEEANIKITKKLDLYKNETKKYFGIGFDIHRLIKKKKLYLGGIKIPFHSGLKGHSDGDVVIHSIIDALLGALGKKDIGTLYSNKKNKFKNIRSSKMLIPVISSLKKNNFYINNLDINLICEKPKVSKYRNKIIKSISNLLSINKNSINLKGKTVEKLGLIGKEKAIACEVITSVIKYV